MVQYEYEDIMVSIKEEHSDVSPLKELFTKSHYFRPLLLGIILQFSVQMTGVSAIQYYSADIFSAAGFSAERALYFQGYSSVLAIAAQAACILSKVKNHCKERIALIYTSLSAIDKVGRRWPLIICNVLSGVFFAIESALIVIYPAESTNVHAHLAFMYVLTKSLCKACGS
jgi:hypothetical protein